MLCSWSLNVFSVKDELMMGACTANENHKNYAKYNLEIDKKLNNEELQRSYRDDMQCVVFGLKNSGKTTTIKTFSYCDNDEIDTSQITLKQIINNIRNNCISTMEKLCKIVGDHKTYEFLNHIIT